MLSASSRKCFATIAKNSRSNATRRTLNCNCQVLSTTRRSMSVTPEMHEDRASVNSNARKVNEGSKTAVGSGFDGRKQTYKFPFDEQGDAPPSDTSEVVSFPAVDKNSPGYNTEIKPVLLNAKEHAVGYLSRILNARVYEAAVETELQHAKNLSAVSGAHGNDICCNVIRSF